MYKLTLLLMVLCLVFAGTGCKEEGEGDNLQDGITVTETSIEEIGEKAAADKISAPADEKTEEYKEGEEYEDTETGE
ncbi:MAG: hypothetical protein ABIJ15_09315 [bacterium]